METKMKIYWLDNEEDTEHYIDVDILSFTEAGDYDKLGYNTFPEVEFVVNDKEFKFLEEDEEFVDSVYHAACDIYYQSQYTYDDWKADQDDW